MNEKAPNLITRRQFIRQAACAAVGTTAITSTIFDLRLINAAAALGNFTDYKALVCVFLYGGNDSNNLLVPSSGTDYAAYAAARQTLFESDKKLAILCNVGTLVGPLTKAQYSSGSAAVPPQLFSHNDQQVQWQTSIPDQVSKTGWGGRCADLLYSENTGAQVSMCISYAVFCLKKKTRREACPGPGRGSRLRGSDHGSLAHR